MINPFAGGNQKPVVEVVQPNQPIGDRPLLNLNFSGSNLNIAR
jgi:hypothetical protein